MRGTRRTLILMSIVFGMFAGCNGTGISPDEQTRLGAEPPISLRASQPIGKSEIRFGRAQYDPLRSDDSGELFVRQPSDETIGLDSWKLTCPSRRSHLLGGGSGIMLEVGFSEGKVAELKQWPWLAG